MDWPHAPAHWLFAPGLYMVSAGTYLKQRILTAPEKRDFFMESLFDVANEFGWSLQAWAVLSNHYHFVALSPGNPESLRRLLAKLHMTSAKQFNSWDGQPGRKVWYRFWESRLTYEKSYLARLHYVNTNPVHHGLTANPENYRWCSSAWFARTAPAAFVKTVESFKTDRLNVADDFGDCC